MPPHVHPDARQPGSPERLRAVAAYLLVLAEGGIAALPDDHRLRRQLVLAIARAAGLDGLPGRRNGLDKQRYAEAATWVRADVNRLIGVGAVSRRKAGLRQESNGQGSARQGRPARL